MNGEEIKKRLIKYIKNEGVNQAFICNKCAIATSSLSKYKNGTHCLNNNELSRLNEYLLSKGY